MPTGIEAIGDLFKQFGTAASNIASEIVPATPTAKPVAKVPAAAPVQLNAPQELAAAGGVMSASPMQTQVTPPTAAVNPSTAPAPMQTMQSQTRVSQMRPLSKAEEAAENDAIARRKEAIEVDAFAKSEAAKQSALLLHQQNEELERQAIENEKQRQIDANRTAAEQAKFDEALENFSNARVNPNRAYENMGVGGRIMATIGQALGAFGAAITHSPNFAQQMIERAIDADIRAQEHEIAKLGARVNMQQNRVAFFRQQGLDNESARAAAKVSLMQSTQNKIGELLATQQSQEALAAGAALSAEIDQRKIDTIAKRKGEIVTETTRAPTTGMRVGEQLPAGEAEKLGTANAAIQAAKDAHSEWDKNASGVYGFITSLLPMTAASRYEDTRAMTKQIVGTYLEGGVLRKEDEAKYEKYLPAAGDSQEKARNKRDKLIGLIATRAEEQRRAMRAAGFNVDRIRINKPVSTFVPVTGE